MNRLVFGLILVTSLPLFAGIEVSSSINDVYYQGERELIGSISLRFTGNDFPSTSPNRPAYIRIVLDQGTTLAGTLVDQSAFESPVSQPIFVPLGLITSRDDLDVGAPAETLSIVRWVAGENEIWLQISHATAGWINDGDAALPPGTWNGEEMSVSAILGISARNYYDRTQSQPAQHHNLPFATRNPAADADDVKDAITTLICTDFGGSTLGIDKLMSFGVEAYGPDAEKTSGAYVPATPLQVDILGSFLIARTKDWDIDVTAEAFSAGDLCETELPSAGEGLVSVTGQMDLVFGSQTAGRIPVMLTSGSMVRFTLPPQSTYGFGENAARFLPGRNSELELDMPFTLAGKTRYRELRLIWVGDPIDPSDTRLSLELTIDVDDAARPGEITCDYDLLMTNISSHLDDVPFGGADQSIRCKPSSKSFDTGSRVLATFVNCGQQPLVYRIPHITSANGGFDTSLLFTAPAEESVNYTLVLYDDQGRAASTTSDGVENLFEISLEPFQASGATHGEVYSDQNLHMNIIYQNRRSGSGPAHVSPSTKTARKWLVYPGNPEVTWDGMAVVNTGSTPTNVTVSQLDAAGNVLNQTVVVSDLGPNTKYIFLSSEMFDYQSNTAFEISAEQPLAVIALRGNNQSDFLWQNPAIPMD